MEILRDVRYAFRVMRRRPGFTLLAAAILALGIGASTAIFSVVDAVLLRSLPYRDVKRLVVAWADGTSRGMSPRLPTTPATFADWREGTGVFDGMAALRNQSHRITSLEQPLVPLVHAVTADYFDVLGVEARLGRTFRPGEDEPGRDAVALLSYALWQSAFGGDPGVVGREITLDERPFTVVGVIGSRFHSAHAFSVQPGLWVPLVLADARDDRRQRDLIVYARLAPGRSRGEAQTAMSALSARLAEEHPGSEDGWSARLVPLREHAVGRFGGVFALLLAAVGLVLLIACADVANLMLVRAAERGRELALRSALGASRGRIARQLLAESLLLSSFGGLAGLALAGLVVEPLARLIPASAGVPFLDTVGLDWRVALFALVLAVTSGVGFGLAPVRRARRPDLVTALEHGRSAGSAAPRERARRLLVAGEVALAVVVAAAAGLMLQSWLRLSRYEPGFDAERVLKLRTSLRGEEFAAPEARRAHFEELQRRLAALPGVASASAVSFEPPISAGVFGAVKIALPDRPDRRGAETSAVRKVILPGYFQTMGIPVLRGRTLTAGDGPEGTPVAVINRSMAERYFQGRDPLGRRFALDGAGQPELEVVGVVGDVMTAGTEPEPQPAFYVPFAQSPIAIMSFVMRVERGHPLALAPSAEREAWSLSRNTNVYGVETLAQRVAELNWRSRLTAQLLSGFAALALLLGAAGIYAVISYAVSQRRAEIGLRMALGARPGEVVGLVVGEALRVAAAGAAAGALAALAAGRLLAGMLYGVTPSDPLTLAASVGLLLAVAAAASAAPALRAAGLDPISALRE